MARKKASEYVAGDMAIEACEGGVRIYEATKFNGSGVVVEARDWNGHTHHLAAKRWVTSSAHFTQPVRELVQAADGRVFADTAALREWLRPHVAQSERTVAQYAYEAKAAPRVGRNDDGYRYIREYARKGGKAFALMERVNGRMKRVGTACTYEMAGTFLSATPAAPRP